MVPFHEEEEEEGSVTDEECEILRPWNWDCDDLEAIMRPWADGVLGVWVWRREGRECLGSEREAMFERMGRKIKWLEPLLGFFVFEINWQKKIRRRLLVGVAAYFFGEVRGAWNLRGMGIDCLAFWRGQFVTPKYQSLISTVQSTNFHLNCCYQIRPVMMGAEERSVISPRAMKMGFLFAWTHLT